MAAFKVLCPILFAILSNAVHGPCYMDLPVDNIAFQWGCAIMEVDRMEKFILTFEEKKLKHIHVKTGKKVETTREHLQLFRFPGVTVSYIDNDPCNIYGMMHLLKVLSISVQMNSDEVCFMGKPSLLQYLQYMFYMELSAPDSEDLKGAMGSAFPQIEFQKSFIMDNAQHLGIGFSYASGPGVDRAMMSYINMVAFVIVQGMVGPNDPDDCCMGMWQVVAMMIDDIRTGAALKQNATWVNSKLQELCSTLQTV